MKDYYNLFVELSLQQCTKNDYGNKLKVKKHNAAYKKLNKLQDEMMKNIGDDALHTLLNHEDDRVKVNAASFCLNSEVLVEQSILTLEKNNCWFRRSNNMFFRKNVITKIQMNYTSKHLLFGTKGNRWGNSEFLKISAVLLTSFAFVVSQRLCFRFQL